MANPPTDETRSFAQQYQLSRQLTWEAGGECWQGKKGDQAVWVYYLPLISPDDHKHWHQWLHKIHKLKDVVPGLPLQAHVEKSQAALAYIRPDRNNLREGGRRLDEWQLAILLLNLSVMLEKIPPSFLPAYLQSEDIFPRKEGGYQWTRVGLRSLQAGLSTFQGTLSEAYLAPEIVAGDAPSSASSVFSLGVCLYELAGGGLAFGVEGGRRAARVQTKLPPIPNLSPRFNQLLQLMLASKPDRRPSAETLHRLASTFMREKQWKSVGGLSFARDVSGLPLSQEKKSSSKPKSTAEPSPVPKAVSPIKPKEGPQDVKPEPEKRSPKERTQKTNKLWPIMLTALLGLSLVGAYRYLADDNPVESVAAQGSMQGREAVDELMLLRGEFRTIIQEMAQNPNLPPTEKTFLRLAQMQEANLTESLQEHLEMKGDQVLDWKGKADMNWLRQTQTQLKRNLQNLELLR